MSQLPWLITVKLCHVIGIWMHFIMPVQIFGGPPLTKIALTKTWIDFEQLLTWIVNIRDKVSKIGKICDREPLLSRFARKSTELWSTDKKAGHVSLDTSNGLFSVDYISGLGVLDPQIFTRFY